MHKFISDKIIQNHRIHYKYFIEKTITSGILLLGWEVKSIRKKSIAIDNSYISFQNKEAFIHNAIFQPQNIKNNDPIYNPMRIRKLLLKKKELYFLKEQVYHNKYTIVILDLFWHNSWVKANIGLAKGKKKYNKKHLMNLKQWKHEKNFIIKKSNK